MNITIEPLLASTQDQVKAMQTLTAFGKSSADRFAQFGVYAGLAAFDNLTHHLTTLARTKCVDELINLQVRSLLPAVESAKVYARQVFTLAAATSRELDHVISSQLSSTQNKLYDDWCAGLTEAEKNGVLAASYVKDTLNMTRKTTQFSQTVAKKAIFTLMNDGKH